DGAHPPGGGGGRGLAHGHLGGAAGEGDADTGDVVQGAFAGLLGGAGVRRRRRGGAGLEDGGGEAGSLRRAGAGRELGEGAADGEALTEHREVERLTGGRAAVVGTRLL